jgi:predicted nucleic acid-binding protein
MVMTIIIDASVAIKCFIDEPGSDAARALLYDVPEEETVAAPALMFLEFHSVLAKHFAKGLLTRNQLAEAPRILRMLIVFRPFDLLMGQEAVKLSMHALQVAQENGDAKPQPANVYDCT